MRYKFFLLFFLGLLLVPKAQSQSCWSEAGKAAAKRWQALPQQASQWKTGHYLAGVGGVALTLVLIGEDQKWQNRLEARGPKIPQWTADLSGEVYWVVPALLATQLWACYDSRSDLQDASQVVLESVLISGALGLAGKWLSGRSRPTEGSGAFWGPGKEGFSGAFPSGHATVSFALAASGSRVLGDRWYYALPLYSLAAVSAWQRIQSGEHWPADVFAGALVGFTVGRVWSASAKRSSSQHWSMGALGASPCLRFTYRFPPVSPQKRHGVAREE